MATYQVSGVTLFKASQPLQTAEVLTHGRLIFRVETDAIFNHIYL